MQALKTSLIDDLQEVDNKSQTPLDYAIEQGHTERAHLLLAYRANSICQAEDWDSSIGMSLFL